MPELTDSEWELLTRDLSKRVSAVVPDWTDHADNDPGVTLVELFGFLAESILARPGGSVQARTRLHDLVTRLEASQGSVCSELPTPTRVRYFSGQLLSPADFEQEQNYVRTIQRRHNLLLHGTGIVWGLDVRVEPQPNSEPLAVVSPGVGIGPDGEELVVCEQLTIKVLAGQPSCFVTLYLAERETAVQTGGQASRIEESAEITALADVPPGHLALARVEGVNGTWVLDASFRPIRLGR